VPVADCGFPWFGHFVFEGNKQVTSIHPVYSIKVDWVMFNAMLTGRIGF
jgi:hypothetical protein